MFLSANVQAPRALTGNHQTNVLLIPTALQEDGPRQSCDFVGCMFECQILITSQNCVGLAWGLENGVHQVPLVGGILKSYSKQLGEKGNPTIITRVFYCLF